MADPPPLLWCCASKKKINRAAHGHYLNVPYSNLTLGYLRCGYIYPLSPRRQKISINRSMHRAPTHTPTHPQTHAPTRPRTGRSAKSDGRTDGPIPTHQRPRQLQSPSLSLCTSQKNCCLRRICKGMLVSSGARTRVSTCARTRARTRPGHAHVRTPRTYARTHPPFRITTPCTSQCPR